MSDVMKKGSPPTMPDFQFPAIPQMFEKLQPLDIPQLTYGTGMVPAIFHNIKLMGMAYAERKTAEIAEYRARTIQASCSAMQSAIMFGPNIKDAMLEVEHKQRMREEEYATKKLENQKLTLECYQLQMDLEDMKLNFQQKKKDMGYDTETEDR